MEWSPFLRTWVEDQTAGNGSLPAGSAPTQKFEGPWFSTQLTLSLSIGITSFLLFCFLRTKWEVVYMGRTKLKDFSPTPAHSPDVYSSNRFFGWIMPTLRTSEFTVLQTVGLDAAVLLNFYKMAFQLFALSAILAIVVLMPLNYFRHGSTDAPVDVPSNRTDGDGDDDIFGLYQYQSTLVHGRNGTRAGSLTDLLSDPQTSSTINLIFTYLFTGLTLMFLHRNFQRFVQSRQSFSLHLIHSVSSRTVLVTEVPKHLRGDKALADYFENCGWSVESVSVVRQMDTLKRVLDSRTNALLKLETAWTDWVGNPAKGVEGYSPYVYGDGKKATKHRQILQGQGSSASNTQDQEPLIPGLGSSSEGQETRQDEDADVDVENQNGHHCHSHITTSRPRPTLRPKPLGSSVDAIDHWEKKFMYADEETRSMRQKGRYEATGAAFVTFEDVKSAQMACQVLHYPQHSQLLTQLAPEPRDVVWSKVSMTMREKHIRNFIIGGLFALLALFWTVPVGALASLLSYEEIQDRLPWLAKLIERSPRLDAIVRNTVPSLAVILFNSLSPFLLEWLSYQQAYPSRSATEYSMLRKYHLLLLLTVFFTFLFASSYWILVSDAPMKIPEKLATALQAENARAFFVSYAMLQALGLMFLQLLNLGPLFYLGWMRLFAKTPRDHAEANAPPMLNYGWVYPQALLIFTITLVYSVVSPLILIFGAIYFGAAYLVYKYKLLFIYFKPYESNGEAWRITFHRLLWALIIFQLFMTGIFSLQQQRERHLWLPLSMIPLISYTLWWAWTMFGNFGPLSTYLALSSVCDVQRGEEADTVAGVAKQGTASKMQTGLNHRRYAINDETLYVAPSDKRTDYSQPPMNSFYHGVLNTGRRRYAHPALSGSLPKPWLPAIDRPRAFGDGAKERRGVVLSLRRKKGKMLRRSQADLLDPSDEQVMEEDGEIPEGWATGDILRDGSTRPASAIYTPPERERSQEGEEEREEEDGSGGRLSSTPSSILNPWGDPTPSSSSTQRQRQHQQYQQQRSYDASSGMIALPDDEVNVWDDSNSEGEDDHHEAESPVTYFHHPERRRTTSGEGLGMGPTVPTAGLPE